jgi:arylsulfatase A-like enzyme
MGNAMNAVLISIDSLRGDVLSRELTPNSHTLMLDGCVFDTTIVQAPYTIPSHASMLTGLYPFNHGLRKLFGQKLSKRAQTIFHHLEARGYFTAALLGAEVFGSKQGYCAGFQGDRRVSTLRNTRATLSEAGDQPFFLFLHYWGVHTPYRTFVPARTLQDHAHNLGVLLDSHLGWVPGRLIPRQGPHWFHRIQMVRSMVFAGQMEAVKAGYARAVRRMDRWLGGVLQILQELRLDRHTVVILTSDHGEGFNEHGEAHEHPRGYEHGLFLYDTLVRVPTVLRGPDVPSGRCISAQVEEIDIVPTIYELLDLEPSADEGYLQLDGQSLCQDWGSRQPGRRLTYSETQYPGHDRAMLRAERHKLIQDRVSGHDVLFDLQMDPGETIDLVRKQPGIYKEMVRDLDRFEASRQQRTSGDSVLMDADELAKVIARVRALGYID